MQFNKYIKTCRKKYNFTQEELVQELYNFDDTFKGLDVSVNFTPMFPPVSL